MIGKIDSCRKGYVRVRVSGEGTERFINLCCANDLRPWEMSPRGDGMDCCMTVGNFRKIKPLVRKAGVRLRIEGRYGLPFFIYRNRKREGLLLGAVSFFGLLYGLSLFVWNITFEGNYHYSRETLLEYLDSLDIRYGMRKSGISCEDLEESIRSAFPEITWVSASVTGTRMVVRVKENEVLSSIPEKDESPCDLTAETAGTITRMVVRQGMAQVAVGDTVEKGQLLVASRLEVKNDDGEVVRAKYVHADADIYARTVYRFRTEEPAVKKVETDTGRIRRMYAVSAGRFRAEIRFPARGEFLSGIGEGCLSFLRWSADRLGISGLLPIPQRETEETFWRYTTESRQLCLFGDFCLPVYGERRKGEEYVIYERPYTDEEAGELADCINRKYLENLLEKGVHIIENDVKIQEYGLSYVVEGTVTGEEEISVSRRAEPEAEGGPEAEDSPGTGSGLAAE